MSISGLSSGLDTSTIVSQLMQLERQPQNMLRTKLTDTKADASAYRTVNSVFTTLQTAAENLTKATAWAPAKAASTSTTVTASATAGATAGSVTFTVDRLAATHAAIGAADWVNPAALTTVTVTDDSGNSPGFSVDLATGTSLADAVAKINTAAAAAKSGVVASAVSTGSGMRLQLTAAKSGADGAFTVSGGISFETLEAGTDAKLSVGSGAYKLPVTSPSNTFADLIAGSSLTVSKLGETATVTVASDPAAVTTAVQAMVTAANKALDTIGEYANNAPGSTAVLRGDSSLRALAGQIVDAVTFAIGGKQTAATAGIQLSKDGRQFEFKADVFTAALKADPALAQKIVNGSTEGSTAVPGVAQRLLAVAKSATDSTTGTLLALAKGKDSQVTDLQKRIDDWDIRLELREKALSAQFTAMETALSKLQNQSSWLSSQLAALPSWSKSSEK